jgi:CYTH domain-containing protein
MIEIERKLVTQTLIKSFSQKTHKQGYLSSVPERTVRVRKGDKAFITIKELQTISQFELKRNSVDEQTTIVTL